MARHIQYFSLFLFVVNCFADQSAMRGWYFYEDPSQVQVQPQYNSYMDYNETLKHEFEEIQTRAIYNPTPENIQAYNLALRSISNNAVRFGMLSVTQNWQDPNAGISLSAPNGAGLQMDLDKQRQQIGEIIKRYAIFYFIDKNCKYCAIETNELKRLEYTYHISVRVISMDGSSLPQYPTPIKGIGISEKLQIKEAGELLAFDSTSSKTTIIGFGYIHFDQIIQRLQTMFITGTADWDQYINQKQPVILSKDNL